jgi:hypothetical protein
MTKPIRIRSDAKPVQLSRRLNEVPVGFGLEPVDTLWRELQGYMDILLGRAESPITSPYLALAECATAYYARASEIDAKIHAAERDGQVMRGSPYYKFRTGELRSFIDLAKRCAELGSRRLTQEQLLQEQRFED